MSTKYTEVKARGKCIWLTPEKWETHTYKSTGQTQDGRAMSSLEVGDRGGYYYDGGKAITEAVTEVIDLTTLQWDATDSPHSLGGSVDTQTAWETNQGMYTLSDAFKDGSRIYGAFEKGVE